MPHRNVVRQFAPDSVYHCYNRGVEKRQVFMDQRDYGVYLHRLKQMLSDPESLNPKDKIEHLKSFYGEIELLSYCLMPNHFHLLLHQTNDRSISEFMRTLSTSYTMYFNRRYKRVGSLFQGAYKARLVDTEPYWLHISRYIHLNPITLGEPLEEYPYSSLHYYKAPPQWLRPERVLECFESYDDYMSFTKLYANPQSHTALQNELDLN